MIIQALAKSPGDKEPGQGYWTIKKQPFERPATRVKGKDWPFWDVLCFLSSVFETTIMKRHRWPTIRVRRAITQASNVMIKSSLPDSAYCSAIYDREPTASCVSQNGSFQSPCSHSVPTGVQGVQPISVNRVLVSCCLLVRLLLYTPLWRNYATPPPPPPRATTRCDFNHTEKYKCLLVMWIRLATFNYADLILIAPLGGPRDRGYCVSTLQTEVGTCWFMQGI